MAERIDTLVPRGPGGPRKYPWDAWADGSAWRITHGVDFECTPHGMAGLLRRHASREGLTVHAQVHGTAVEFQFSADTERAA